MPESWRFWLMERLWREWFLVILYQVVSQNSIEKLTKLTNSVPLKYPHLDTGPLQSCRQFHRFTDPPEEHLLEWEWKTPACPALSLARRVIHPHSPLRKVWEDVDNGSLGWKLHSALLPPDGTGISCHLGNDCSRPRRYSSQTLQSRQRLEMCRGDFIGEICFSWSEA